MKTKRAIVLVLMITLAIASSCSSSNDDSGNSSRTIKYEISGTVTGDILISYANTPQAGYTTVQVSNLPWSAEVTYNDDITMVALTGTVTGATSGQTIAVKLFSGDELSKSYTGTADSKGMITIPTQTIIF
ncbi:MAG: hypothetical protein ACK5JD_14660 [Mangrovibacterium sp.]